MSFFELGEGAFALKLGGTTINSSHVYGAFFVIFKK